MEARNTSDSIEAHIKRLLEQTGIAEIQRSQLAEFFEVVPSQINYVIKTRFTESRGYVVESKRGGGGYIRITKVSFSDQHHFLGNLLSKYAHAPSEQEFRNILQWLYDEDIITEREGNLLLSVTSDEVLGPNASKIRAQQLRKLCQRLDRKG